MSKYLNWIKSKIDDKTHPSAQYDMLLNTLYRIDFTWIIDMDQNRAVDGIKIRQYYIMANNGITAGEAKKLNDKPCSVLEMIFALAKRCEESIMEDPLFGDRTSLWFWTMIQNLGLNNQTNRNYNSAYVNTRIDALLNRTYAEDGGGGLFTVKNHGDLRNVEIWYQAMWYFNNILED